jgi:hypothetical protein
MDLRICKIKNGNDLFYFHKWIERGETQNHPEDPEKDSMYVKTLALIENVKTGEVCYCRPNQLQYVKDEPTNLKNFIKKYSFKYQDLEHIKVGLAHNEPFQSREVLDAKTDLIYEFLIDLKKIK